MQPRLVSPAIAVILALLVSAAPADARQPAPERSVAADYLYQWNEVMFRALRDLNRFDRENRPYTSGDNPPRTSRAMAMVHAALYDAVNGITGTHEPYRMTRDDEAPASVEAAVMEAGYVVLNGLFGDEGTELAPRGIEGNVQNDINSRRATQLVALIDRLDAGDLTAEELEAGRAWGAKVGQAMLEWRAEDGADRHVDYDDHVIAFGKYRMDTWTPDAASRAAEPGWGGVEPFALQRVDQFELPGPPDLGSAEWERDLDEVRRLGRRDRYDPSNYGGQLPEDVEYQMRTAFFWSDKGVNDDGSKNDRSTVTPPGHWVRIAQSVAQEKGLTLEEAARLFALLSLAGADATIACWHVKYHDDFWRPIHAVRWEIDEASDDPDADWIPLIPTSMHPEYVSGHSTASGASASVLATFFGTDAVTFSTTGDDALEGEVRTFASFSEAAEEAGRSRIYGGIHYEFANQHGLELGRRIGRHVTSNFLRPLDSGDQADQRSF